MSSREAAALDAAAQALDGPAAIEAARARGAHRFDPVRFHFMEALARRAAAQDDAVQRVLDEKLLALLQTYEREWEASLQAAQTVPAALPAPRRGVLGELADELDRRAQQHEGTGAASPVAPSPAPRGELKAVKTFRSTWTRLSAERRLAQSLQQVPDNAGPLHSQQLIHRSLTLMRDVSPQYLHHFMSYVDGLFALDQLHGRGEATGREPAKAPRQKKPAQDKAR